MINGCLILKKASVTIEARIIIIAKSVMKGLCGRSKGLILSIISTIPWLISLPGKVGGSI